MSTISFKGRHFQHDMILQSMRWYLAYALSYRDIEEMMAERGRECTTGFVLQTRYAVSPIRERPLSKGSGGKAKAPQMSGGTFTGGGENA